MLIYYSQSSNHNRVYFNDSFESYSSSKYFQEQRSEREEVKNKISKKNIYKSINAPKFNSPVQSLFKKTTSLINGSIFGKKHIRTNKANKASKFKLGNSKKTINHELVSNGETSENENSEFSQNFRTINLKNKKLLKFRKEKNDVNEQIRQYTSKNIRDLNKYSFKIERREKSKSKTIKHAEFINLNKNHKVNNKFFSVFKPDHLYDVKSLNQFKKNEKNDESHFSSRNSRKKNSFSMTIKGENNLFTSLKDKSETPLKLISLNNRMENSNFQLPTLGIQNLPLTERVNDTNSNSNFAEIYRNLNTNLFQSINVGETKLKTFEKEHTLTKKESSHLISKIIKKPRMITKFHRKQTMNLDLNFKTNLISRKLLKKCKLNVKNNKFLKKLKRQMKNVEKIENGKKSLLKDEVETSKLFIENKVNDWMLDSPLKDAFPSDNNLEFNENENSKYKKKEQKFIHIIVSDFIKKISSPINASLLYLNIHKGLIEKDILRYIRESFFDIIMPSCLFENNDTDKFNLCKIPKKNSKKLLLRQKTSDNKKSPSKLKMTNSINKFGEKIRGNTKRLSTIEHVRKGPFIGRFIPPLDEDETKYIIYYYHLDVDIDGRNNHNEHNEEDNKNANDDQYSFLSLLKEDLSNNEVQELLKNKFINRYMMKNGGQEEHVLFNRKKSIKNNISSKCLINSNTKNARLSSLFKNNFFSRNEIKYSKYKMETTKKKKSLLEYNLLFDPNLNGYNNLIADGKMASEANEENSNIEKDKLKEIKRFKNNQLTSLLISSGGMKTDKNIYVMKTLDLKNQYNHKNKGNINSLTSSIKDCNYDSFVKFYRACNCGPNAIDKDGNSLLSLAVKSSCLEIVNFLLDEKANPNLQNVSYTIYIIYSY